MCFTDILKDNLGNKPWTIQYTVHMQKDLFENNIRDYTLDYTVHRQEDKFLMRIEEIIH